MDWFEIEEVAGKFRVVYHHEDGTAVISQVFMNRPDAVAYCAANQTALGLKEGESNA